MFAILPTAAAAKILPLLLDGDLHPVEVDSTGWIRIIVFIKYSLACKPPVFSRAKTAEGKILI